MKVYIVWDIYDEYPESGGGEYVREIFADKNLADKYCEKLNKEEREYFDNGELMRYFEVEEYEVCTEEQKEN